MVRVLMRIRIGRAFSAVASFAALLLVTSGDGLAFPTAPATIPNGSVNRCDNCHTDVPALNAFGEAYKEAGLEWGASLANGDADQDTFPDGWELQDPTGTWQVGQPDPGVSSIVSNPGDATSEPPLISLFPDAFEHEEAPGENLMETFETNNAGGLILSYAVDSDVDWMSFDPDMADLMAGESDEIAVLFDTTGLAPESMLEGTISVSAEGVMNSPQEIAVTLVLPEPSPVLLGGAATAFLLLLRRRRAPSKRSSRAPW